MNGLYGTSFPIGTHTAAGQFRQEMFILDGVINDRFCLVPPSLHHSSKPSATKIDIMPFQPLGETAVLSLPREETAVLGSDSALRRLQIHTKDPLTIISSQSLGLKGAKRGASLSVDCSVMAKQPHHHHQRASSRHDIHSPAMKLGALRASMASSETVGSFPGRNDPNWFESGPAFQGNKGNGGYSASTVLANGLQQKRGSLAMPNPDIVYPSATPLAPMKTPNMESHARFSYNHPDATQPNVSTIPQLAPRGAVPSPCNASPRPCITSPLSPIRSFHSAHASPIQEYDSPQSSPVDLVAYDCQVQEVQEVFPDLNTTPPSYIPAAQSRGLVSSHVSIWKKVLWLLFTTTIFLLPYTIYKACFQVHVTVGASQTSVTYGKLMMLDFLVVILFSTLNRRQVNQRVQKRDPNWEGLATGILAVGYREDPVLLEGCLKSLRASQYQRNHRVMLVVDGNEDQDEYMAQMFLKVFEGQGASIVRTNFLCMDQAACSKEREDLVRQIASCPGPVCVMQPHRGKRSAMYTGFAAMLQQGLEAVVVTDSDTFLDPDACKGKRYVLKKVLVTMVCNEILSQTTFAMSRGR